MSVRLQKLVAAVRDRAWARTRPSIPALFYANGGIGDELMLTAIARAARLQGKPFHVLTNLPELWRDNRDPLSVQSDVARWFYARTRGWIKTPITHLAYETTRHGRHIAQQMADHVQVTLPPGWQPQVPAIKRGARVPGRVVLQNSCRGARYACTTKEWSYQKWQELAGGLAGRELIQIGTPSDPVIQGARDLRGRTSLYEAGELIATSAVFVGLESGLMHLAAAVGTPAVIVYGGRTLPTQTGYPFHHHVTRTPECAGCGLSDGCPYALKCLADISVAEVLERVQRVLQPSPATA